MLNDSVSRIQEIISSEISSSGTFSESFEFNSSKLEIILKQDSISFDFLKVYDRIK